MTYRFNLGVVNVSTSGTSSPLTLTTAVSGFKTVPAAADGLTLRYTLRDGANSESCSGVYTHAGTTITRTTLASTNSDNPISLSGNAIAVFGPLKEDFEGNDLGTGDTPQFASINIGHASDTTIARSAAGKITVEGNLVPSIADPGADRVMIWDESANDWVAATLTGNLVISGTELRVLESWGGAISDETTAITTGTGKLSFSIPYEFNVIGVYAKLNTASSSGTPTFDINDGGTTILSTKIVIDANELTGGSASYQGTASGAAVISDAVIAAFAQVTVDIDVAGTGAKGAKVFIIGYRT